MSEADNSLKELRVAVVEDNPADIRLVEVYLSDSERYSFVIIPFTRLSNALDAALDADIVLLDLNLPDSQGMDTLSRFQAEYPLMPVIMLTGYDDVQLAKEAMRKGAQDYLVKGTFTSGEIIRAIPHAIERYSLVEELIQSKKVAEAASRAKGDFLANMSHEIRTPMNAIVGGISLLKETEINEEQGYWIDIIQAGSASLSELIDDILDFSKIEADRLDIEISEFSFLEYLDEVLRTVSSRAHEKNLELICNVSPRVPCIFSSDPKRLRQIILNLLGNAIKFTHEGMITLLVEFHNEIEPALKFTVTDTGIGIPPSLGDSVFDSFTQVDSSTCREYGGTGLGLTISKRLTELLGGKISYESLEQGGCRFTFNIALTDDYVPHDWSREEQLVAGIEILLIDEREQTAGPLRDLLEFWGAELTVSNAKDAVSKYLLEKKGKYSVILIDFSLVLKYPEFSGLLMDEKLNKSLPIIMLSDAGNYAKLLETYKGKYSVAINKPVLATSLYSALRSIIHQTFER